MTIPSEPYTVSNSHCPTILAVDDDPANLAVLSRCLEEGDVRVIVARDGESALERAQYGRPDLILLDVVMPKMDGFETCRRLKANKALRDIPVIFMTALTNTEDRVQGFHAGGVDYVTKPFQHEELLARIKTHLALHATQKQLAAQNAQLREEIGERKRAEEALRESEELHRLTLTSISDAVFITDGTGTFTFICPNVDVIFGYSVQEVQAFSNIARLLGEDLFALAELEASGEVRNIEREITDKAGKVHALLVTVKRVSIRGGAQLYACRDITERRQAEEALRKSKQELETKVAERTEELRKANEQLQSELAERRRAEESLREAGAFLGTLLNAIPVPIFYKDTHGRYIGVNKSFEELCGKTQQELVGKTVFDIAQRDLAEVYHAKDLDLFNCPGAQSYDSQVKDARGAVHDVVFHKATFSDPQGRVLGLIGVILDITDRKQAEEAADRASREWERTFDAISDLVMVLDDQHRILRANKAMADALGMAEQELKGKLCFELVHGEKVPPAFCPHSRLLIDGREHSAEVVEPRLGGIYDVRVSPLVGQNGRVIGSVHVTRDITDRKRAEELLRESEELHRLTISNISDTVLVTDDNGAFTYVCPNTSLIFVHSQEEVEALGDVTKLMGRDLFDPLQLESRKHIDNIEWTIIDKGGQEHVLLVNVKRVSIKGGTVLYTCRDITDRKRAEESLRESHAFLDTLLNAIPAPVFYKDTEGRYIGFNKSFGELYGKTQPDLVGKSVFDIVPRELAELHHAKDLELLHSPGILVYDSQVKDASGAVHDRVFRKATFSDPQGRVLGLIGVILDITERKRAEEALDRANQEWKLTFDAISDPVMVLDDQHRILRANKAMADALGMMEQELIGKHCFELVHGENEPPAFCPHSQLLADGERHSAEVVEPRLGGIYDVRVSPIIDQNGRVIGSVHVTRDITERIRAERDLQKSNELLRAIIEAAPTAIAGLDLDGNVQMVWNPAAEKMLGWSAQEVMGRLLPSVPVKSQEEFRGFRERIRSGKTLDGVEVRRQRRDGTPIDYSIYASPLYDPEGRITGNVCVLVDITGRKHAEEALRASEEKYRTLFEESIDGVYSVLRDGEITDGNTSFCKLFGYTREETIGKDIREFYVDPADRPRFQKEIEKKGFVRDYEVKMRRRDGTEVDCLITSSVHFGEDGGITGYRGIIRDLTLRKALQKQLLQAQKMESIGTLAGGIAHDFNNLLQVVLGYSDMMLFNRKPTDPDYEGLHAIRRAGRDGSDLANRILAFSRRLEPNARPVNLNNEITRVEKMLKRTVPKMIQIELLLADDVMTVNADPGQIEQILLNLAVNAQHAMPDGGRLTIETANIALDEYYSRIHVDVEPGKYVLLTVSDTGHGMDKEVVEHIFEPFYTTKGPGEGTGLGLAMVYGIVKSHKGHIACYSESGMGTTFKIYLPAIVQEIEQDVAATQQMTAFGTETILLVDDEKSIRRLGERMLRMAGYSVLTAANGREALEVYRSSRDRIALVVLDLMMPEMGGKQCLEELLKINPKVRVVIASGYSVNGPTKDAVEAGTEGFISKPYAAKELLGMVRKLLDESQ